MTKLRLVSRAKLHLVEGSPDQPRDNHGRWTTGGGVSETSDHAAFNKMLSESKRARFLTMHDADDFKQGRAFMLHDVSGDAGMFLTHDGDLRNLVNNDGPGKGSEALKLGVQSGAKTLGRVFKLAT
jgi:hypothetical protein